MCRKDDEVAIAEDLKNADEYTRGFIKGVLVATLSKNRNDKHPAKKKEE